VLCRDRTILSTKEMIVLAGMASQNANFLINSNMLVTHEAIRTLKGSDAAESS
jgi:hypothetical protein